MNVCAVPLSLPGCEITAVVITASAIKLQATLRRLPGICPACQTVSTTVHGYYWRQVHDLPIWQKEVVIDLRVRRFRCQNRACGRQTYAQGCPDFVKWYQRNSHRLVTSLYHIGQELGGKAGARLAAKLSMTRSRDTLLRIVRRFPETSVNTVRILGLDDWAMRKGRRYGTILVDLEARRVVDLLQDRTAETVKAWLLGQPQIEMVARDRSKEYALAIHEGAPAAIQVADRWHLLKNLSEATERSLQERYPALKKRTEMVGTKVVGERGLRAKFLRSPLEDQRRRQRKLKKMRQYELCHYLRANGLTQRRIASIVGLSRGTVIRYLRSDTFPEKMRNQLVSSILNPYLPYLEERYQAECHNAHQLWREIQGKGYPGSPGQVRKWVRWRQQKPTAEAGPPAESVTPILVLPQPSDLYRLLMTDSDKLTEQDNWLLERATGIPEISQLHALIHRFRRLVTDKEPTMLADWLFDAKNCPVNAFANFAKGIEQDDAAVQAALSSHWSNGQTEGQVNRLKMLKRQMFGRAKLDLLKKRIMYPTT